MLKFDTGIGGSKLPMSRGFLPVPLSNPGCQFATHPINRPYPPIQRSGGVGIDAGDKKAWDPNNSIMYPGKIFV
jgi:hypothetical protein